MTIKEGKYGYEARFDYDYLKVKEIKAIPGSFWRGHDKVWVIPKFQEHRVKQLMVKYKVGDMDAETVAVLAPESTGLIPELPDLTQEHKEQLEKFPRKPFAFQEKGIAYILENKRVIVGDQPGLGKAQPLTAKIATPNGWKLMGEIKHGDDIIGADGKPYKVNGVFPQGERKCYRVMFNDGTYTECDEDHIWQVRDVNRRRRDKGWITKTAKQLLDQGLEYRENNKRMLTGRKQILKWEIPLAKAFDRPKKDFVIAPYIMGVLLGDGSICGSRIEISIPDTEIVTKYRVQNLLPYNLKLRENRCPACPQYAITQNTTTRPNPFKKEIERLEVNVKGKEKFIPQEYLFSSYGQRLELLRGLMDSDGSAKNNRITFHTCSERLAEDISILVFSLGGQAIKRMYDRSNEGKAMEWQVNVRIDVCPFHMERKSCQWSVSKRNYASRYIQSIEFIGLKEQQCISVTAPDKLYLTDYFIVTHNTTQAAMAITLANAFPCLIICPSSLKLNWQKEWMEVAGKRAMLLTDKVKKTWHQYHRVGMIDIFIVNYESLKKYFVTGINKPEGAGLRLNNIIFNETINLFKSVIIDESHKCKDGSTQQSKFCMGITRGKEWILELTGTPVVNKPKDLIAQLHILGRLGEVVSHIPANPSKKDGGYTRFINRYCGGGNDATNLQELNYRLSTTCFYRREKTEVLKDLPPKIRQVVLCEISNRAEYTKAETQFVDYLKEVKGCTDAEIRKKLRGQFMVQMGVLKQVSARGKINAVKEYVDELRDAGQKVILFCHLKDVAKELKTNYPHALQIAGGIDLETRNRAVELFQNDPAYGEIICSIKAAGVGLTLTAASWVGFVEFPWTFADCEQCEDRAHRIGQYDSVQCAYFLGENTIDRYCYELIQKKKSIAQTITGASDDVQEEIIDELLNLFNQK